MAIPSETIEQVAAANDIVEVIGTYFPLKRAGTNYKALCPFHQEKTPSFVVSPQRQTFHCFGCGIGGSVFRFVMNYEHVDFPSAVRKLAVRVGIRIIEERTEEPRQRDRRALLLKLHAETAEWLHENLLKREIGAPARSYLKERGLSREIAKSWKLGYAPQSWDALCKWAIEQGYTKEDLISSGLVSTREPGSIPTSTVTQPTSVYDRFRDRLMFPIWNDVGEVIAFSGRILTNDVTAAKYINSPETPLFRKGRILFGLHKTKRALIEANCAIICEGQLDLIRLFEAGIQNVVAPQGTAFTDQQTRLLKHFVQKVVLCFDADSAGEKAAQRSLEALLENDLLVYVAEMPAGEDPDSLVGKAGREGFEDLIASATDFFDYWLERKAGAANLSSLGEKMRVARELAEMVNHVRQSLARHDISNKIAARLSIRVGDFEQLMAEKKPAIAQMSTGNGQEAPAGHIPRHEVAMLCLLALRDDDAREFLLQQDWRDVLKEIEGTELLRTILEADLRPSDSVSLNAFQTTLSAQNDSLVSAWLLEKMPAEPLTVAREWWNGLRQQLLQRNLEVVQSRLRLPNLSAGEVMQLQKQVLDLHEQLHDLPRFSSARAQ